MGSPIDLRLIASFAQVARLASFSAAAKHLGVSAAAVSQNVKNLEARLGARLFARTTRRVGLTVEGRRFLEGCAPALDALNEAAATLRDERDGFSGTLRIASTTAFGRAHVLPVIAAFQAAHPDLRVELSLSDAVTDLIAEGFDLAVRAGVLKDSGYVSRLILPVTPVVCGSPAYLDKHGRPADVSQIADHRVVGMRLNTTKEILAWEFAGPAKGIERLEIDPHFVVNDPEAAAVAAVEGMGLAQVGTNIALPKVREGKLEIVLADRAVRSRGIYAVYPSRKFLPKRVSAFVSALALTFSERADLTEI